MIITRNGSSMFECNVVGCGDYFFGTMWYMDEHYQVKTLEKWCVHKRDIILIED